MFVFISVTCSSPLYVLQIKDPSVRTENGVPRSELNSGFLITITQHDNNMPGEWGMGIGNFTDER